MNSKQRLRISIPLLAILLSFIGGFWIAFGTSFSHGEGDGETASYPELWSSRELPELPGAKISRVSSYGADEDSGIKLEMTTNQTIQQVREFFESEFHEWDFTTEDRPSQFHYFNEFQTSDSSITVEVLPDPRNMSQAKVRLTYVTGGPRTRHGGESTTTIH